MDQHEEFLKLFMKHQGEIRAFLGSLVRDRSACEDILQDVSLVLWREFARYDRARSFGAWARGIAAKKVMQFWDKKARTPLVFAPDTIQAVADAYDRTEDKALPRLDALQLCLEKVPADKRQLLHLRYSEALKLHEIAAKVRSTLEAVHKALARLRQKLEECVQRRMARS